MTAASRQRDFVEFFWSFVEFFTTKWSGKDWLDGEKERYDTDLDKNKDDAEIIGWIIPDNSEIANDEVNHLFASSDEDVSHHGKYDTDLDKKKHDSLDDAKIIGCIIPAKLPPTK
jgi:hypothetical protein